MSEDPRQRKVIRAKSGFFQDTVLYFRLVLRLMIDGRVSPLLKLIPFGSLIYVIFPLDIPGPIDDLAVFGFGLYMFVEMCPPDVVEEHMKALKNVVDSTWEDSTGSSVAGREDEEIIEAEFREDS